MTTARQWCDDDDDSGNDDDANTDDIDKQKNRKTNKTKVIKFPHEKMGFQR